MDDPGVVIQNFTLGLTERVVGLRRHDKKFILSGVSDHEHIASKVPHLLQRNFNNILVCFFQYRPHCQSLIRIFNSFQTNNGKYIADTHQNVGMVYGFIVLIRSRKGNNFISQSIGKGIKYVGMGSGRQTGIGNFITSIQYHAASSFKIFPFLFKMREVYNFFNLIAFTQGINDIHSPFRPTVLCHHGI